MVVKMKSEMGRGCPDMSWITKPKGECLWGAQIPTREAHSPGTSFGLCKWRAAPALKLSLPFLPQISPSHLGKGTSPHAMDSRPPPTLPDTYNDVCECGCYRTERVHPTALAEQTLNTENCSGKYWIFPLSGLRGK